MGEKMRARCRRNLSVTGMFISLWLLAAPIGAAKDTYIALVIDDLGYRYQQSLDAINLPGPVTCSFLPFTPHGTHLAERAYQNHKEVMLHLPMESIQPSTLGPGALLLDITKQQFKTSVSNSLKSIPHVAGINNHMGSLLTRHPGHMTWLMEVLVETGNLFFLDSKTTPATIASQIAEEHNIPHLIRDVFLDPVTDDPDVVRAQFELTIKTAKQTGFAIGIGHPYPQTLKILPELIETLPQRGIKLVHTSELLRLKEERQQWHAFSSPSPKAVKN